MRLRSSAKPGKLTSATAGVSPTVLNTRLRELREVYLAFEESLPAIAARLAAHDLTNGETS